jgi:hypothetical protein
MAFGVVLGVNSTALAAESAPLACVCVCLRAADGNTDKYAGPLTPSCIPRNGIMPNSFVNMASVQTYSYRNGEHRQAAHQAIQFTSSAGHLFLGLLVLLAQLSAGPAVTQACRQRACAIARHSTQEHSTDEEGCTDHTVIQTFGAHSRITAVVACDSPARGAQAAH